MAADGDTTLAYNAALPAPRGVVLVPSEQVLLLAVPMPGMSASQRRAAAGFAVEGMIARPLDDVRVVLGPVLPGGRTWLVAVIAADTAATFGDRPKTRFVPDVLMLPIPAPGRWSVWQLAARVLVRAPDGTGFATDPAGLPYFHLAAGRPDIVLFGGALDPQFSVVARGTLPASPDPSLQQFDLAQGSPPHFAAWQSWRPFAAVAAVAGLAHLALLATDVWALHQISAQRQNTLRTTLGQLGQPADTDLDSAASAILAQAGGAAVPQFVPLTAQAFAAISAEQGRVTTSELRFAADGHSLTLQLQAPDIATLQNVETALTAAGFQVDGGAATTREGLAEQELTLAGGGT